MAASNPNLKEMQDSIETVDPETVETGGAQYPFIQWVNGKPGNKKLKDVTYTGGWFIAQDNAPGGAMPPNGVGAPWEPCELTHDDGETTEGFACRNITVALVRSRARWFYSENGAPVYVPWNAYEKGKEMRGHRQVLVCLQGLETTPFALTMKGMASASFDKAIGQFVKTILNPANALVRPKRWPHRAFWITLGPQTNGGGEPHFTDVGRGSQTQKITLMAALGLPDKPIKPEEAVRWFVGKALLAELGNWWTEAEEWATAWDSAEAMRQQVEESGKQAADDAMQASTPEVAETKLDF
jgi:hypothetical protein